MRISFLKCALSDPLWRCVITCASVSLLTANKGFSQGDPIFITPQSDTFAASGPEANSSSGDSGTLLVNGATAKGIERRGFLTFMFTGQTLGYKSFSDAKLELHMASATKAHTLDVYGVNHPVDWDERTLTWDTAPSLANDCTLLDSCEVKPGTTSVVVQGEKLLEFVNAASPRSVSFVLAVRNDDAGWNDAPYQFYSKEYGLKKEGQGAYLSFGPSSPRLILTPDVTCDPISVDNQHEPPTVTINGRDNSYYKIQYKEKTSNVWKTAPITAAEAGRLYLDGVITDAAGYAKVICGQLTNKQADIKLEEVPFYTVSPASDPTFATMVATKRVNQSPEQHNWSNGSKITVNRALLERGLSPVSDPRLITKGLDSAGEKRVAEGVNSRWYQVDGNTQVFRSLENEGSVVTPRVEACTGQVYDLEKKQIVCFEATYFLPRGGAGTVFQLSVYKNRVPELGIEYPFTALHANSWQGREYYGISHTRYTKVQAWRGEKQYNFLKDAYATNVTIRFRIDGTYYEYSLKKPDGTYDVIDGGYLPVPSINGKKMIGFRWGMYPGHGAPATSRYGLLFVTGAKVTFETGKIERPAWAHNW